MIQERGFGRRAGLTLVELLAVLFILALVAGIAVSATEGLIDQSRYDASERTLRNLEDAILGQPGQRRPDGTEWMSGFVADVGRLPQLVANPDPGLRLQELWSKPPGMPDCSLQNPLASDDVTVLDSQVRLSAGWRGPYLQFAAGPPSLKDGWGRPVRLLDENEVEVSTAGQSIVIVRSLGADDAAGGTGFAQDFDRVFHRTVAPTVPLRYKIPSTPPTTAVAGTVTPSTPSASDQIVVRLYGPKNGVLRELCPPVSLPATGPQTFEFKSEDPDYPIYVGPKILKAYQIADTPPTLAGQPFATPPPRMSPVTPILVVQGGISGVPLNVE